MGSKIRCLKCGDIIESKHVHDFRYCSCENIFIDGGNDYTRYGGAALEDGSAEFLLDGGKTLNVLDTGRKPFHGICGYTKINLARKRVEDPMYLDIDQMIPSKSYRVFGYNNGFTKLNTAEIKKSHGDMQLYKYLFKNDCSIGKQSFGTEESLIATPNCPILKLDGTAVCIGDLKDGEKVLSMKRLIYNKIPSECVSTLIFSFKYYAEQTYNIMFMHRGSYFCANGFFIGSLK